MNIFFFFSCETVWIFRFLLLSESLKMHLEEEGVESDLFKRAYKNDL